MARAPASKSDLKQELRQRHRAWLQELIKATGKSASQIAAQAGVSDTTLTRLLNNPDYEGTLSQLTIDRIKETYNVGGPEDLNGRRGGVLGFSEAERVSPEAGKPEVARLLKALAAGRNAVEVWLLKTDALSAAGYLPGDLVVVDMNLPAQPQDAVCAIVHDLTRGAAETVWRIFTPPFLIGASLDRTAYRPLLVDNHQVRVSGVIVAMVRPHSLSATR